MRATRRARARFLAGWIVCVGVLVGGALVVPWQRGRDVSSDSSVNVAVNPSPQFGIEPGGSLADLSPTALSLRLAAVKELGVTWVRFDVNWALVQPNSPSSYNWAGYDRVANALNIAGLHALGIIDYPPLWAQGPIRTGIQVPPALNSQYAAFAAAVAARFAPKGLHAWEIWNEPNWAYFWPPTPNAAAYTAMLKAAYVSIHHANPGAAVIVGGLSGAGTSGRYINPQTFLSEMYAAGAGGFFDAVAMHPYTFPRLASDTAAGSWQDLAAVYHIMQSNGDGGKKIWITEYGAPTDGPGATAVTPGPQDRGGIDHVSESAQAQLLTAAIRAYESLPFAGPFFWYNYQDLPTGPQKNVEDTYGLLRADGTPKPAYTAYQQAIAAD